MVTAKRLGIPEGSLNMHLKKRAVGYARKNLLDLDLVAKIYDEEDEDYGGLGLEEAASTSIFEAWWNKTLDADEYTEYCNRLADMRIENPILDGDLHTAVKKKEAFIEQRKAEKKAEREAAAAGVGFNGVGFDNGGQGAGAFDPPVETVEITGDWDTAGGDVIETQPSEWDTPAATGW